MVSIKKSFLTTPMIKSLSVLSLYMGRGMNVFKRLTPLNA